jgi:multidrug resistance efflux pump
MSKLSERILGNAKRWSVPGLVLLMAAAILFMITVNWNSWASERVEQETDDAYTHADLTPLSTKVAGLVAAVPVSDYQTVKKGDPLVQLRDDDFRAQIDQAEAAVTAAEDSLVNNERQKELQNARVDQAGDSIRVAEADITAAQAGIEAAKSAVSAAQDGIEATKADVQRTELERGRQEALIATQSATRQKLEQVVADAERFRAMQASRESDLAAAKAQLASRQADFSRAQAHLGSSKSELEAQKRERAVLDAQTLQLHAALEERKAALAVAHINLGYTRILAPEDGGAQAPRRGSHHHRCEFEVIESKNAFPLRRIAKRGNGVRENRVDVPLLVHGSRLRPDQLFPPIEADEGRAADFIQHDLGPNAGEMIVNTFAFGQCPFIEANRSAPAAQVLCQFGAGETNLFFGTGVCIERNQYLAALPGNPVEIGNRAFHIQSLPVRTCGLCDHSAPVEHAGKADGKKSGRRSVVPSSQPR